MNNFFIQFSPFNSFDLTYEGLKYSAKEKPEAIGADVLILPMRD